MRPAFFSYLLLGFFLAPAALTAQVKFSTVPGSLQIRLDDVLQVTYTIENAKSVEDFRLPAFRDFKVVQGPVRSEGSMITNGVYSHYSGITYVLQPLRKGSLPLAGATALVDGQKMTSNKVVIDVSDKAAKASQPYPRNPDAGLYRDAPEEDYILKPKENASQKIKDNLLVEVEADKKTAYVGEPVVATYKLYTRLRSNSRVTKWPSLNGFSVYDMLEPDRTSVQVETRKGKKFMSHIIRKIQLVPLQEGDFVLDPVELDNQVQFLRSEATDNSSRSSGGSLIEKMFEGFFDRPNGTPESYQVSLSSTPQTVHIKPLPAGAPESFNGAVGRFSISGRLVDSSTHAGDPVQYDLQVEGAGNLPLVTAPEWKLPGGLHLIEPTVTDTINKSVAPMEGRKTFRYSIMPDAAGTILLPAIEFSYFDPAAAVYKTLRTDSAVLIVKAGKAPQNIPKNIATAPRQVNGWLIGAVAGAPLVFALLLLLYRRTRKPGMPAPAEIPEEIPAAIHDPLLPAKNALANNDATAYFHGIHAGLWEVVTDVLSLPGSAQQQPQALQQLAARGLPEGAVRELAEIWNTCDWILYLPAASHHADPGLLPRAEALVEQIRDL